MSWNSVFLLTNPAKSWSQWRARPAWQRISTELFWVCGGQVASAAGCVAGVRLLTEVMSPGDYGRFMLAMTLVTLVQQVLGSPLTVAAQRFYATAVENHRQHDYWRAVRRLMKWAAAGIAAVSLLVAGILSLLDKDNEGAIVASAGAFAILLMFASVMDGLLTAARRRIVVAWHQAATQWLRWCAAAVAVILMGTSATVALLGGCIALLLLCVTRWIAIHRAHECENAAALPSGQQNDWQTRLCEYSLPFALWGLFTWALTASDRWALAATAGAEQVGSYAVLYQLGFFPCLLVADALQQLIAPILFQRAGSGTDVQRYRDARALNDKCSIAFAGFIVLLVGAAFLLHRPLLFWLAGPQFREHSYLLPFVMLAGGLFALGQLAALSIVSGPSARALLPVKIGSALIGIALNFAAAHSAGLAGVVAATAVTSALYVAWTMVIARREHGRLAHACSIGIEGVA